MTKFENLVEKGQHRAKVESAKKMVEKGIDLMMVSEVTGLSFKELEQIIFDLKSRSLEPLR